MNDEEKLRFVLSVLPLDTLHRLAVLAQAVQKAEFGKVSLSFREGYLPTCSVMIEDRRMKR